MFLRSAAPPTPAGVTARRQLGRVLTLLGLLDLTVMLLVLLVAVERSRWGLSNLAVFAVLAAGAIGVILTRILLAVRLRSRAGNLR
ncbi:MAG TPA: hypothetical protein VML94_08430 [Thermoplasmata archaeon]|nr:hypothetical protein [Thermoplasmata archaeon]